MPTFRIYEGNSCFFRNTKILSTNRNRRSLSRCAFQKEPFRRKRNFPQQSWGQHLFHFWQIHSDIHTQTQTNHHVVRLTRWSRMLHIFHSVERNGNVQKLLKIQPIGSWNASVLCNDSHIIALNSPFYVFCRTRYHLIRWKRPLESITPKKRDIQSQIVARHLKWMRSLAKYCPTISLWLGRQPCMSSTVHANLVSSPKTTSFSNYAMLKTHARSFTFSVCVRLCVCVWVRCLDRRTKN